MKKILFAAAIATLSANAMAGDVYGGAGLSSNSVDGLDDNATGFQFFAGYDLRGVKLGATAHAAIEAGYMDTGDFNGYGSADGLWATGVIFLPIANQLDFIGRAGLDFGDDDGFMFGLGLGYSLDKKIQLRGEYVIRDNIDSLQANIAVHF